MKRKSFLNLRSLCFKLCVVMTSYMKVFEFSVAVRGYHYYKSFWTPEKEQSLECFHEIRNPFDRFAIKVCELGSTIPIGHLPREISRVTKFFMDRGAIITAQLTSEHYRRSPLVQGGLEIPCKVTVTIPGTCANLLVMEKYKQLVDELYVQPKEEQIIGSFLQPLSSVIEETAEELPCQSNVQKPKKRKQYHIELFNNAPKRLKPPTSAKHCAKKNSKQPKPCTKTPSNVITID